MMTGLLRKDAGTIRILGLDINTHLNKILKNIGILIETPIFYEHLSAEENLKIHLAYMDSQANFKKTIDMVGLSSIDKRPVSEFSVGMRARLAIARSIIHNPQILILDEPINGLDPQGIRDMRKLFKNLCEEHGKTILLSSHTLKEIEYIADTIGVLANGIVEKQTNMIDIKKKYSGGLEDYYFDITGGI